MMTDEEMVIETVPFWRKRRYLVVLMGFFGFTNVYTLRINLSVAIVAMTEIRTVTNENGTISTEQDFDWDTKQQGLVLSSFFYGYILTQVIGGYIASRIGGSLVSLLSFYYDLFLVLLNLYFRFLAGELEQQHY